MSHRRVGSLRIGGGQNWIGSSLADLVRQLDVCALDLLLKSVSDKNDLDVKTAENSHLVTPRDWQ